MLTEDDKQWIMNVLRTGMDKLRDDLHGDIERARQEGRIDLEKVETTLLTEFHKWASPVETRVRSHSSFLRALDVQSESMLDDIKDLQARIERLEQNRLNPPRQ